MYGNETIIRVVTVGRTRQKGLHAPKKYIFGWGFWSDSRTLAFGGPKKLIDKWSRDRLEVGDHITVTLSIVFVSGA